MITDQQKKKIIRIVNAMETGTADGRYDQVTILADGKNGAEQITYGRSQATEQGNLKNIIQRYIGAGGKYAPAFSEYMPLIGRKPLVKDARFKQLLKASASEDPLMREAQDETFEILYYVPAFHFFRDEGFTLPLSMLVIYDSYIHSGSIPAFLRSRFPESTPVRGGDEKGWIAAYLKVRQDWLANHSRKVLRPTIYRTKCYLQAIQQDNWQLDKPVRANGVTIP
jgi:chitosanase